MIHVKQGKRGATLKVIHPQILLGLIQVDAVFSATGDTCTITGFQRPPRRGKPSLHPDGWAFDLRANHLTHVARKMIKKSLELALGETWDVILHGKGLNIHYHCEYQPKPADLPAPR